MGISWSAVPGPVRAGVEARLGSRVAGAVDVSGGHSEGAAARLRLAGGRDVFVKAAADPAVRDFHRREAVVAARLPVSVPSPPLLFAFDDGPWAVLVFEFVAAVLPSPADRPRVLDTVTAMASALTPAPVRPATAPRLGGFAGLAAADLARVSPWAAEHLDDLVALESAAARDGDTLLHGDLYLFNALVSPSRVYIVDWAHAWVGPRYCDALMLMAGAPDAAALCAANPLTRDLPPRTVDAFLAAHAGFLLALALRATNPAVGVTATALGRASAEWLSRRLYSAT
ncbi:hypothetical protein ACPPVO_39045 [Dactylosporangium sp. McL0621]|uniref:hypothetical protein n=1 Tax=Dactylosporangium sp. McL0621 TaxID=3415678 RepID=UPI003CEDB6F4